MRYQTRPVPTVCSFLFLHVAEMYFTTLRLKGGSHRSLTGARIQCKLRSFAGRPPGEGSEAVPCRDEQNLPRTGGGDKNTRTGQRTSETEEAFSGSSLR